MNIINTYNEINQYVVSSEYYNNEYVKDYDFDDNKIDTIMLKSTMGTGKTKSLKNLFEKYKNKKIVIVSFRITLDKEYVNNFPNFELYSDIKETVYDTDIYNKMVIQIDSFYKIQGNIDLLILDEFTYTATHLIERVKNRESVYNALLEYIYNYKKTKILIMDALLDIENIKYFYNLNRKIHYICNKFKKHSNINCYNYSNKIGIFVDEIIENIKDGKKIVVPTNSKNFLDNLEYKIKTNFKDKKSLFLNADNSDDINLDNWNNYDVVGYTPTIVAGISFEKIHFDKCFAYFVNNSSPAEMSLQQLFRVRNLTDKEIHICIEKKDNNNYLTKIEDMDKYIIDRNTCMVDGVLGIKISRINKTIKRDSYYYLYRNSQLKLFKSKNNYENVLVMLLISQGIVVKNIKEENLEKDKKIRKEIKETSSKCKDGLIKDIIIAEDMEDDEYYLIKNKTNLTYNDKNRLKKKKFRLSYFYNNNEITFDMYKKFNNKYRQFKNINAWYTLKDDIKKYIRNNIQNIEDEKIKKNDIIETPNNENILINNYSNRKILTSNTFILHQNKSYEKFIIGLEILSLFNINNIFEINEININFEKIYNFIKEKEYILRLLFNCKSFDIVKINNNEKDLNEMIKYLNSKLRTIFNVYIKKTKKSYEFKGLELWTKEISPFKENENIKMELLISNLINCDDDE